MHWPASRVLDRRGSARGATNCHLAAKLKVRDQPNRDGGVAPRDQPVPAAVPDRHVATTPGANQRDSDIETFQSTPIPGLAEASPS